MRSAKPRQIRSPSGRHGPPPTSSAKRRYTRSPSALAAVHTKQNHHHATGPGGTAPASKTRLDRQSSRQMCPQTHTRGNRWRSGFGRAPTGHQQTRKRRTRKAGKTSQGRGGIPLPTSIPAAATPRQPTTEAPRAQRTSDEAERRNLEGWTLQPNDETAIAHLTPRKQHTYRVHREAQTPHEMALAAATHDTL